MRHFTRLTLAAALAASFAGAAFAGPASVIAEKAGGIMKVGLWGDEFYSSDEAEKADWKAQTVASMNSHNLAFTLFAGDTKNGSSLCTDQAIGQDVIDVFNSLNMPTVYSLGDNEWTDCHRTNNGSMDPLERLAFLRMTFFNKATAQGPHAFPVERQGELGGAYSENSRFVRNSVEFVAVHVPGSNNNLVTSDKQCTSKSGRTLADCQAATAEYEVRNAMNVEWLKSSFAKARAQHLTGVAIVIQADIFFPFEMSDGGYAEAFLPSLDETVDNAYYTGHANGYRDFWHTVAEEVQNFDGEVVLIHGDSHYFKLDKPMIDGNSRSVPNFTRVEVFGSSDNSWVEMTVNPNGENVFTFAPVVLK